MRVCNIIVIYNISAFVNHLSIACLSLFKNIFNYQKSHSTL